MAEIIHVYCDESCHLENDHQVAMVLGALSCPAAEAARLNARVLELKKAHRLTRYMEVKWTKVSQGKLAFYLDLVDMFFSEECLHFRAWVIPDKSILDHKVFDQSHDEWYYKMYFNMLKTVLKQGYQYRIFADIKDTRSRRKLERLRQYLANANYDFRREMILGAQHVHSHDIGLLQLADLLIGAVSFVARGEHTKSDPKPNAGKIALIEHLRARSGLSLERNTLPTAEKVNLCFWHPRERNGHE